MKMTEHSYCQKRSNYFNDDINYYNSECDDTDSNEISEFVNDDLTFDKSLLEKIKENPSIYQKNSSRKDINEAWENISDALNESVENCQKRYQRMRQYYAKERKRQELVAAGKIKDRTGWLLFESAKFLDPFIAKRRYTKRKKKVKTVDSEPCKVSNVSSEKSCSPSHDSSTQDPNSNFIAAPLKDISHLQSNEMDEVSSVEDELNADKYKISVENNEEIQFNKNNTYGAIRDLIDRVGADLSDCEVLDNEMNDNKKLEALSNHDDKENNLMEFSNKNALSKNELQKVEENKALANLVFTNLNARSNQKQKATIMKIMEIIFK